MSLKRHCDICDKVIYASEDYHFVSKFSGTIGQYFGGEYCICKECWQLLIDTKNGKDIIKDFTRVKNTSLDKVGKVCDVCIFSNRPYERACEDCRNHDQFIFDGYIKKEADNE